MFVLAAWAKDFILPFITMILIFIGGGFIGAGNANQGWKFLGSAASLQFISFLISVIEWKKMSR